MIEIMPPANDNANEKRQRIDRISTRLFFLGVALLLIGVPVGLVCIYWLGGEASVATASVASVGLLSLVISLILDIVGVDIDAQH